MPERVARANFVEKLVNSNSEWIGLAQEHGRVKVLDYGAGTGFFSQVGFVAVNGKEVRSDSSDDVLGIRSPCHPNSRNRQLARHGKSIQ